MVRTFDDEVKALEDYGHDCCARIDDRIHECCKRIREAHEQELDNTRGAHEISMAFMEKQPSPVAYDVLGNERHKAICKLREMPKLYPHKDGGADLYAWKRDLANAIGADTELFSAIRDRLIHLLGGDTPNLSDLLKEDDDAVDARPSDAASADSPVLAPAGRMAGCACDQVSEVLAPVTQELREYMEAYRPIEDAGHVVVSRIGTIGFEGFDRLCDNIDAIHANLERENEELRKRTMYPSETERVNMLEREVKRLTSECKTQRNNFDQATSAREHWKTLYEQALEQIHDLEHDVEMWRDRAEDMRMERDDALRGWHRYPDIRDADHVPIRIGDVMDLTENVHNLTVLGIGIMDANRNMYGVFVREGSDYVWYNAEFLHHHGPTVEGLIRGAIVRCIGHLPEYLDEPIAECAAKLKLSDADA